MNEPWGLSGPEFLRLYLVGAAVCVLIAVAARIVIRGGKSKDRVGDAVTRPDRLDVGELAYLAGGPRRVVETVVARLVDRGLLRASRGGTVQVVAGATARDAVDRAVLDDTARFGRRTVGLLVDRIGQHDAIRRIGERLIAKGLLVDQGTARARRALVPLAALLVVGAVRLVNGVSEDRPVAWLALLLAGTAGVLVGLWKWPLSNRTFAGDRALREARSTYKATAAPSVPSVSAMAGTAGWSLPAIALLGFAAVPDEDMRDALYTTNAHASSASHTSSGGSSCGGTSSGGGDGGGGGGGGGGCGGGCGG